MRQNDTYTDKKKQPLFHMLPGLDEFIIGEMAARSCFMRINKKYERLVA
jgi:hypothetical protein